MSKPSLVWLDLEMTGLTVDHDVILEIAAVITTDDLMPVIEYPSRVLHATDDALARMDTWCQQQHRASGLIDAVKNSNTTLVDVEESFVHFLKTEAQERPLLCGNSIHQDRIFLKKYLPRVHDLLHYRMIDVSTIKEVARRWYPKVPKFEKAEVHRARADVYAAIDELKYYREKCFMSAGK